MRSFTKSRFGYMRKNMAFFTFWLFRRKRHCPRKPRYCPRFAQVAPEL